ncbi:GM14574 [Drosophila sechellia]|uniref:GM14574 n=1 Tax=Drosophila sechellia TaxID=7238 RepID=B4HTS0_DROSE|nr:GM14574 [Drosophila sechellia]
MLMQMIGNGDVDGDGVGDPLAPPFGGRMMVMSVGDDADENEDGDVREWGVFGLDCAFDKVKLFDVRARGLIKADLMRPEDKQRPRT